MYEWDPAKAASNLRRHGVSFADATSVFLDQAALTFDDPDHSNEEEREITIVLSARQRVLFVSHGARGDRIRIISARKATRVDKNPFKRFASDPVVTCGDEIVERWRKAYEFDRAFAWREIRPGKKDSVLPHSEGRFAMKRWEHLSDDIDQRIRRADYEGTVPQYLETRVRRGNPKPHYGAILVEPGRSYLFQEDEGSRQELIRRAGADHVHVYVARAIVKPGEDTALLCVRIQQANRTSKVSPPGPGQFQGGTKLSVISICVY